MTDWMMFKDPVTTVCAVIGAVLGVLNTVTGQNQRRVRLRVRPKISVRGNGGIYSHSTELLPNGIPSIEVINLSAFPVTISEVGFKLKGGTNKVIQQRPLLTDDKPFPRRLDSRESFTVLFPDTHNFPKNLGRAYATTDCDEIREGDSPALKKFRAMLQQENR